jgi:bifunctional non-homologous end joining protein LigD
MSLRDYQRKRDFSSTKEPKSSPTRRSKDSGQRDSGKKRARRLKYVIQKHQASHLHYDLRLEFDGVLKSWAVPKGPSLNPSEKRLAMKVEDHPLDYASFEGIIPEGEYGAGEVEIWDKGYWEPADPKTSVRSALKAGSLKFEIIGEKLKGRWALVQMKKAKQGNAWLLIKEKDVRIPRTQIASEIGTKITRGSKVLYPEAGITKNDLAEYYIKAASRLLPHVEGRPLMILRCPDGRDDEGFFQKNWNKTLPSEVKKISVKTNGERRPLLMVDSLEGLLALAQLGVLELHTWGTHFDHIENPDEFVFDIDPHSEVSWDRVVQAAYHLRGELAQYGMKSFLKTTGGKGLHVVSPVLPQLKWELGKKFCKALCQDVAKKHPNQYVLNMAHSKRTDRIFLDYLRNGRGATAIAPYSPRARTDAPLSIPIDWSELKLGVRSDFFHLRDIGKRLNASSKDPWKGFFKVHQLPTG